MRTIVELDLAKRAAKRLGRIPSFWETPHAERLRITAIVLGFEHWRSFQANATNSAPGPLDEQLDAAGLTARRSAQAERLKRAVPRLRDPLATIEAWQPTARTPTANLCALDDIKTVVQGKNTFFEQGMHRAYIIFFREMMDWSLFDLNVAAAAREPLAYTHSRYFDLDIPLLAPAPLANNPTGFEPEDLRRLESAYPNGAIALLGVPLLDQTPQGDWFTPGALVMDGQSWAITLRAGLGSFDDLFEIKRNPDRYRLLSFHDVGQWCRNTFAKCRYPKWQLDNGFDEL